MTIRKVCYTQLNMHSQVFPNTAARRTLCPLSSSLAMGFQGLCIYPYGLGHILALTNIICTSFDWNFPKALFISGCPSVVLPFT